MLLFRMQHTARETAADLAVQVATILLLGILLRRNPPLLPGRSLPALVLTGWIASGFTLGMLCGNLLYSLTHLAIHRRPARNPWVLKRQRWHAGHHRNSGQAGRYGVITQLWDQVLAAGRSADQKLGAR